MYCHWCQSETYECHITCEEIPSLPLRGVCRTDSFPASFFVHCFLNCVVQAAGSANSGCEWKTHCSTMTTMDQPRSQRKHFSCSTSRGSEHPPDKATHAQRKHYEQADKLGSGLAPLEGIQPCLRNMSNSRLSSVSGDASQSRLLADGVGTSRYSSSADVISFTAIVPTSNSDVVFKNKSSIFGMLWSCRYIYSNK